MKIENYWSPNDNASVNIRLEDLCKLKPSNSIHPLNKLRQLLKQQAYVGIGVLIVFLLFIFVFRQSLVTLVLIPICLYLVYFLFRSFKVLQSANQLEDQPNESILKKIKLQFSIITNYVKSSETIAVFLYPLSILAGMIITFSIMGEDPVHMFSDPYLVFLTIAAVLFFVPIQYLFTRKMNEKAFGSHLEHLKNMIDNLDENYQV